MIDLIVIIVSAIAVIGVCGLIVSTFSKWKKEMDDDESRNG